MTSGHDNSALQAAKDYMASLGIEQMEAVELPGKNTKPLLDPGMLRRAMELAVGKAERLVSQLEARVELLVLALQQANHPIPGAQTWHFKHQTTANGRNIVIYLLKRFEHVPELVQQVQVACFRFHELAEASQIGRQALTGGGADDALLEDLKRKTYYAAHMYDHFKDEPLLRQIFPAPAEAAVPKAGTARMSGTDAISRYRIAREGCARRADATLKALAPGMERVRHLAKLAGQDRGAALLGLLNPSDLRERQLIKRMREKNQLGDLTELVGLVEQASAQLPRVAQGAPFEMLEDVLERLTALHGRWAAEPHLADVLPPLPPR